MASYETVPSAADLDAIAAEQKAKEATNPQPPTIETVLAAGYGPEAAKRIVAEEQAKALANEPPYIKPAPCTCNASSLPHYQTKDGIPNA